MGRREQVERRIRSSHLYTTIHIPMHFPLLGFDQPGGRELASISARSSSVMSSLPDQEDVMGDRGRTIVPEEENRQS